MYIFIYITKFPRQPKGPHLQPSPEEKCQEFEKLVSEAARPFLSRRTDRFVYELEVFLASGLTLDAYDAACMKHLEVPSSFPLSIDGFCEDR